MLDHINTLMHTLMNTPLDSIHLLLGVSAIACALSVLLCLRGSKKNRLLEIKLAKLERDLRIANNSAVAMGQDLIGLEKRVHSHTPRVTAQQSAVTPPVSPSSERPSITEPTESQALSNQGSTSDDSVYDEARKLLSQGLAVQVIAKRLGLSYAEVSLLDSLSKSSVNSY